MDEETGNPAGVDVAADEERHVWTLEEWPITQVAFERGAVRLLASRLDGSAEIRIGGRLLLRSRAGEEGLDAADTERLGPLLTLLDQPLRRVTISRGGGLELVIASDVIEVRPDPRFQAWEAHGSGVLDGFGYRCPPGGGAPWG